MYESVEARGYSLRLVFPLVLAIMLPSLLLALSATGAEDIGDRKFAVLVAAVFAIPVLAGGTFKLRLRLDPTEHVLTVTLRFWFGISREWRLPLDELESWYYVKETQSLVLRRRGQKPLRFILFMGDGPDRVVAWGEAVLSGHADPMAGVEASKRAKRALLLGFGLGFPLFTVALIVVLLMIYGA